MRLQIVRKLSSDAAKSFTHSVQKFPGVQFTQKGRIGVLSIDAPEKMNAITVEIGESINKTVQWLKAERSTLGCVIITGSGKSFSAGGDFNFLMARTKDTPSRNQDIMLQFYKNALSIREIYCPTIACLNGHAIGAGLSFACAADIRIALRNGKYGFTFTQLGLHPGMGTTHFLPQIVGASQAMDLIYSGRKFDGDEAVRIGLAKSAFDTADECMEASMDLANSFLESGPFSVRQAARTIRAQQNDGLENALLREALCQSENYASAEFREGLLATKEKRKPDFINA